ncbi:NUDIX domain-containing protein [Candidatus Kaiserbacteria bacterium]|nr:NUDIX domain-containing protein [Candidatus Kaiserbacteria bacterium]
MIKRGCGVLFYNVEKDAVLVFRRDDKPNIPFPNMLDVLGGHVGDDEDPEVAITREMAEELWDNRTGQPYILKAPVLFKRYVDVRQCEQSIYWHTVKFEISDLTLLEGKELVWLTRERARKTKLAFEFEGVMNEFFEKTKNH